MNIDPEKLILYLSEGKEIEAFPINSKITPCGLLNTLSCKWYDVINIFNYSGIKHDNYYYVNIRDLKNTYAYHVFVKNLKFRLKEKEFYTGKEALDMMLMNPDIHFYREVNKRIKYYKNIDGQIYYRDNIYTKNKYRLSCLDYDIQLQESTDFRIYKKQEEKKISWSKELDGLVINENGDIKSIISDEYIFNVVSLSKRGKESYNKLLEFYKEYEQSFKADNQLKLLNENVPPRNGFEWIKSENSNFYYKDSLTQFCEGIPENKNTER